MKTTTNIGDLVACAQEDFVNENQQSVVGVVIRAGKQASLVHFGDVTRWMSHEWLEMLNEAR